LAKRVVFVWQIRCSAVDPTLRFWHDSRRDGWRGEVKEMML